MIFRLVSAANERGDFLPLPLSFASHDRMRALSVLRCFPSARQQPYAGFMQCRPKAMGPAWLAKIPPLACGQSAPFDKGVYTTGPARLAANAIPGNR